MPCSVHSKQRPVYNGIYGYQTVNRDQEGPASRQGFSRRGGDDRQSATEPFFIDSVKSASDRRNCALRADLRMQQPELWLLGTLFLIAALLLIFIFIAQDVFEGETMAFDRGVILAFRSAANISDPIGPPWVEEAARDITALGSIIVVAILSGAVIFYLLLLGKRGPALLMLISVAGGSALNDTLKYMFDRPRPDLVLHAAQVFTSGFPSGHAAVSAVVYLTL